MTRKLRRGSLYQRGSVYWLKYMVDGRMLYQSLDTTNKAEAEKKRSEIMRPLLAGAKSDVMAAMVNRLEDAQQAQKDLAPALEIAEAWPAYERAGNRPDSGPRTLAGYASQFSRFQRWLDANHAAIVELRHVDSKIATAYAADLKAAGVTPSTYNQHIKTLDLIWSVLKVSAKISVNPWAWDKKSKTGMQRLTINKVAHRKKALSLEQIETLLATAAGDYKDMLTLLAYTGQRLVDIVMLMWDSVDFRRRVITLCPRKTERRTAKEVFIPLLPAAESVLLKRKRAGKYVFPDLVAEYHRDVGSAMVKKLGAIFDAAGLDRHKEGNGGRAVVAYGAHSLRHGFITIARAAGIPDAVIRQITGHSSSEMVEHYTQFDKALAGALAMKSLDSALPVEPAKALPPAQPDMDKIRSLVAALTPQNARSVKTQLLALLG